MTCETCQLACYDLLDRSLCAKDERDVLAHIESCPQCRAFLEEEGRRMRTWPRLLGTAARNATVPSDAVERVAHALEVSHGKVVGLSPKNGWAKLFRRYRNWTALAASLLILAGVAVWQGVPPISGLRPPTSVSPVTLIRQKGATGLDLPVTLPGRVSLSSGEGLVRLQSGVELTLVGPINLDVRNCLEVCLERGRLLANVPHEASGFIVRTRDLEICDLGTLFSVALEDNVSDVFVFKGRVQVTEPGYNEFGRACAGVDVGICKAGEGVRSVAGERPKKIAADWPVAQKMFASVKAGRSLRNPVKALETAAEIADLWAERNMPMSKFVAKKVSTENKILFQNTAWVRSAVPQKEEASNMNKASAAAVLTAAVMMGAEISVATSAPIQVDTSPGYSRHWHTVFTSEVPLHWNWNAAATHAELEIKGMNASFTTNFTEVTSNGLWQVFTSDVPTAEDVYDLTLTFYSGVDAVVGVQTSRLAVVTAAFGRTAVIPTPTAKGWTTVRDNVVIPYDVGWATATAGATNSQLVIAKVGGSTQTNALSDVAGYYGWKVKRSNWGYGTFNLALTFPGMVGEWDATLTRPVDGTLIRMR